MDVKQIEAERAAVRQRVESRLTPGVCDRMADAYLSVAWSEAMAGVTPEEMAQRASDALRAVALDALFGDDTESVVALRAHVAADPPKEDGE